MEFYFVEQDMTFDGMQPLEAIRISFGNSYVGIFDTEAAKAAAAKLFQQYGIELKKDVPIKVDGYEFTADGYDEKLRIGFELVVPDQTVVGEPQVVFARDEDTLSDLARAFETCQCFLQVTLPHFHPGPEITCLKTVRIQFQRALEVLQSLVRVGAVSDTPDYLADVVDDQVPAVGRGKKRLL